jgi:hypothetical protein
MPVKAETTAAALQLLQPKTLQASTPAATSEPSKPSVAPQEPCKQRASSPSSSDIHDVRVPSTHAAVVDNSGPLSPTVETHTDPSRQRTPSPQTVAAVDSKGLSELQMRKMAPPVSDDETQSGSSDDDGMHRQQLTVSTKPALAPSAGASSIFYHVDVRFYLRCSHAVSCRVVRGF